MGKDPVTATRDVRAAVEKELGFDPRVDAAHISVRNIGGDVTLAGTVPSCPQYLAAAAAARRVAGVSGVHNHLEVVLPEGAWRDDVATWPGPAPPRRSPSSSRTCATTGTTRRVPDRRLEFRPPQRPAARPDRARRRAASARSCSPR